jgi:hypothetical protein
MEGFHDKALHLLPAMPETSETAAAKVAEVEARIGRPLPAAVRDWYVRKDACDILRTYSPQHWPVALEDMGRPFTWKMNGNPHGLVADGLLHIMMENQGVCMWAVRLDDGDDPAVVVNYREADDLSDWQLQADTFSDYVFCRIWDFGGSSEWGLQAVNVGPVTEGALDSLCLLFRENVRTWGWPGDTQYRFDGDGQRLLIWNVDGMCADWFLSADNEPSLAEAARKIWLLDDVGKALWSHQQKSKAALARIAADMATR